MDRPVTLWLPEQDHDAVLVVAARYRRTPDAQVRVWIDEALTEARRHFAVDRWDARRKAIEADPVLAATVDAAVKP